MNLTALLRIIFRWKWIALFILVLSVSIGVAFAYWIPLKYEAQMLVERKPVRLNPEVVEKEFDMIRLTSEMQRNVALLKSRFMMERWMEALSIRTETTALKEKAIRKLERSLTVKPVNYTDLLLIKARASSPDEAKRRVEILTAIYADWDQKQEQTDAERTIRLLKERMQKVKTDLAIQRSNIIRLKTSRALRLSASTEEEGLVTDITAKEKLYDSLTAEFEEAERRLYKDSLHRLDIVTPAVVPLKPLHSRFQLVTVAISIGLLLTIGFPLLMEWQDPSIRRAGDVSKVVSPQRALAIVPKFLNSNHGPKETKNLESVVQEIQQLQRSNKTVVIQITSPSKGDGKSTVSAVLAQSVHLLGLKACILNPTEKKLLSYSDGIAEPASSLKTPIRDQYDFGPSLGHQISSLKKKFDVIIVDHDNPSGTVVGQNLMGEADIAAIVMAAGHCSDQQLRLIDSQLNKFPHQKFFYILNQFQDPLPRWLLQ